MSKTLYISDLDGTLLNTRSELSPYTTATLNRLIAEGMHFSLATGRTAFTTERVTRELDLRLPTVQLNGAYLYDFGEKRYLEVQYLTIRAIEEINAITRQFEVCPLVYTVEGNVQTTHYERIAGREMRMFVDVRRQRYGQVIPQVADIAELNDRGIVYYTFVNSRERLEPVNAAARGIADIASAFYRDVALPGDVWMLEIFADTALKSNGVNRLRALGGFDRVVGFGDAINDLPLFSVCDECYAVANADDAVKRAASGVIGGNDGDGVARWLDGA